MGVVEVGASASGRPGVVDKGLKKDALGFVSSCVIGVASTAPGYSLAASLGFVVAVAGVGLQAPAVLLLAFVPMLLIASAYYYMNRADPDCGTTFSWVTRAMGPLLGWLAVRLAAALDAEVVVAFAYRVSGIGSETSDYLATLRERGEAVTREAIEVARAAGVQARGELVNDDPDAGLADLAGELGAQMIVVGSYGERPLRALILGSTPPRLMHLTQVPVLVVRER
jgi:nucleotide-binding universal stress UspA family protein